MTSTVTWKLHLLPHTKSYSSFLHSPQLLSLFYSSPHVWYCFLKFIIASGFVIVLRRSPRRSPHFSQVMSLFCVFSSDCCFQSSSRSLSVASHVSSFFFFFLLVLLPLIIIISSSISLLSPFFLFLLLFTYGRFCLFVFCLSDHLTQSS